MQNVWEGYFRQTLFWMASRSYLHSHPITASKSTTTIRTNPQQKDRIGLTRQQSHYSCPCRQSRHRVRHQPRCQASRQSPQDNEGCLQIQETRYELDRRPRTLCPRGSHCVRTHPKSYSGDALHPPWPRGYVRHSLQTKTTRKRTGGCWR